MKLRHAAALALVGWYLMAPLQTGAPISKWASVRSFDSPAGCEDFLAAERDRLDALGLKLENNCHAEKTLEGAKRYCGEAVARFTWFHGAVAL